MGDDDEVDDETLARLADSFHSEGGRSGRRKRVSWSGERRGGSLGRSRQSTLSPVAHTHHLQMTSAHNPAPESQDSSARGRPLSREIGNELGDGEWSSTSAHRRSSRASKKGATMVFLGAWALFGLGTLANSGRGLPTSEAIRIGRVLNRGETTIPYANDGIPVEFRDVPVASHTPPLINENERSGPFYSSSQPPPEEPGPSTQYIIGRISAWTCTTLYLTSRLPQIWKNV